MATTVNAKIYSHHVKADGTFNVKYVVYHKGERKFIDSPHIVSNRQITKDFQIKDKFVLRLIEEALDDFRILISAINSRLEFFTCEELRDYLRDSNKDIDIIEFADAHIEQLKRDNREPYSRTFRKIKNSLIDYFGRSQVSINEIHSNMLFQYERYLKSSRTHSRVNQLGKLVKTTENGLSKGGLHAHMRDLRTLFNEARRKFNNDELGITRIKHYPFTKYKVGTPPPTRSRNFSIEQVIAIRDVKVPAGSRIELAKDLFMLSFYLCGTNAVDLYNVGKANIKDGRLEYNRSKTQGRRQDEAFISIRITEEAAPLIEKYIGQLNIRYGAYDYLDYALYKGMKGLRELLGFEDLTLYWARHTFGTLARNECRIAVDDIAEALNHIDNGHFTTDIYLAKDWSIVDDVQSQVIRLIKRIDTDSHTLFNHDTIGSRSFMKLVRA